MMSQLKKNTVANIIGKAWTVVLSFAFIPVYVKLLGVEAYGLVGLFALLQNVFLLLDLGIGATLNRELARLSATNTDATIQRNTLRTLEIIYWSISLAIGTIVFMLAPLIARHWINHQHLSLSTTTRAICLMAPLIAFQFPFSFYQGGLMGLQKQVTANGISVAASTARSIGAILVLRFVAPTIECFFAWQLAVSFLAAVANAYWLWRAMPGSKERSRFQSVLIRGLWGYAASWMAMALANAAVSQVDKVVLSKLLSLDQFGYYTLAQTLPNILLLMAWPVCASVFPRFTQLIALQDEPQLARLYHQASQFLSVMLMPAASLMVLFSKEIMMGWTGNPAVADATWQIASILALGNLFNGLATLATYLRVAYAWFRVTLITTAIIGSVSSVVTLFITRRYGAVGAASVWTMANFCILMTMLLTHRRYLKGEQWRWLLKDLALPFVVVFITALICRTMPFPKAGMIGTGFHLGILWCIITGAGALSTPHIRAACARFIRTSAQRFFRDRYIPFVHRRCPE